MKCQKFHHGSCCRLRKLLRSLGTGKSLSFVRYFMPLRVISEIIIQPIAELAVQIFGYFTSRIIVPIFTLGLVHVEGEPIDAIVALKFGRIQRRNNKLVMDAELGALVGIVFWLISVVGIGYYLNNT